MKKYFALLLTAIRFISQLGIKPHAFRNIYAMGMSVCGKINANLMPDCTTPLHGGVDDLLYLINWADISDQNAIILRNGVNPQIIENIILSSGALAYYYQGKNGSVHPSYKMVVQKYARVYEHNISAIVFDITPTGKAQLETLAQGRVVAIAQNRYKGTGQNCAFEVYGLDAGLLLSALSRDPMNADSAGAFEITLTTDTKAEAYEGHLPATFFKTDYPTTQALVNALI